MTKTIGQIGQRLDLNIRRGADFGPYVIALQNPDGTPVDLTGTSVAAAMRRSFDTPDPPAATFTTAIDGPAGEITLNLPAAANAALDTGPKLSSPRSRYVWDLVITWTDGRVEPLLYGEVRMLRGIS